MADYRNLDAYSRHKLFINNLILYYNKNSKQKSRAETVSDSLKEQRIEIPHSFLPSTPSEDSSWEERIAFKYYQKLFKHYALISLVKYKEGRVGLRWRTQKEVIKGKGQFICGSLECAIEKEEDESLLTFELNFKYIERGDTKNALVKVRLCSSCSKKLHFYNENIKQGDRARELNKTNNGDGLVVGEYEEYFNGLFN